MTKQRTHHSAILATVLIAAGAASTTTSAPSTETATPPAVEASADPAGSGEAAAPAPPPAEATTTTAPPVAEPEPQPEPEPEPEPQPEPEPEPQPEPEPEPQPQPEPEPEPEPEPDPDPDPGPDPNPHLDLDLVAPTEDPEPPIVGPAIIATQSVCGVYPPIPDDAASVTTVLVDASGDGTADDAVTSYYDAGATEWRIRLAPSGGSVSELAITGVGPGFVEVLGAVHVDTEDPEQILAIVGSGASAYVLGVFGADSDGCLFRFTWHGSGDEVTFAVGGTIGQMSGLQCHDADGFRHLSSISAVSNGPGTGTWNIYGSDALRESEQTLLAGDGFHAFGVPDGDPLLTGLATADCPGITL